MNLKQTILLISVLLSCNSILSQVKVYEGVETIPTYKRAPDVTSPIFYTGRGVQGAAGKIYPYPAQTNFSDVRTDMDYNMVYLENEYLKVTILPGFGGKIYSAVDKTTGYEIIHSNTSIKYDLIGTLGAWVSGGIEWCFPHHHRPSTLLPVDYVLKENEDGSATVWIGETERTSRLRGIVGVTLHPGCSYFEVEYRLNNPTDITKTFLFWANASMTANKDYRTFWPPQQEIAVNHNNSDFIHWPVANTEYKGTHYENVDLTWWKNHPEPKSFFFWDATEGFIGGYDYSVNSGTVHVGNVHENKTSKLFQFGPGTEGQAYRKKLTDDGKAYVELMTGTFSNNQPDYSWFAPHSVKDAKNYWYGIRDIEMAKNANIDAAVTLQMRDNKTVFYGFNTTRKFNDAKVVLTYTGRNLVSKVIDIDPANPFTETYTSQEPLDEYQLFVQLLDKEGNELISYRPYKLQKPDLPEVQEKVKLASEIETIEDLFLTGQFVEQFSSPFLNADDYYLAALEKSPNDYRVNLALGIRRVNQWRYQEALEFLQKAADKLKIKYWQPKNGDIFYYTALAQKALGLNDEAYSNFYRATWYYEWFSAGFYQLALMESTKGDYAKALDFVKEAWTTNNHDGRIAILYSALSRKLGMEALAIPIITNQLEFDPINYSAHYEYELLGHGSLTALNNNMSDVENNYLDIAINYANAGLYTEGIKLLTSIKNPKNPMVYYYLAWFYEYSEQQAKTKKMLSMANSMSVDYIFPYRKESEKILKYAVKTDAQNSVASYLLGNLLFDNRKDDAISAWEDAGKINPGFSMIWRNLAFAAFHHQKNADKAIYYLTKALDGEKNQPLWYAELARYYDASDKDYKECLALLEANIDVVKIDAGAPKEVVKLLNLDGQYDKSIELLKTHHFRTWEGGRIIHSYYVNAYTLRALESLESENYRAALEDLEAALLYPENLEVGKPNDDGQNALINHIIGEVYSKMGKKKTAKKYYALSANTNKSSFDLKYYQGMSSLRLGKTESANELFNQLIAEGDILIIRGASVTGIGVDEASSLNKTVSDAYYLQALGKMGLGNIIEAKQLIEKSLAEYKNNLWASYYLKMAKKKNYEWHQKD